MKEETKGNKIQLDFGKKRHPKENTKPTFIAGGRKRALIECTGDSYSMGDVGMVAVNGLIRMADGTEAYAVLIIDENSSGEHFGTGVFVDHPDVITFQDEPDFLEKLGKTKEQVFPYKYKYDGEVRALCDHHVGADGWS